MPIDQILAFSERDNYYELADYNDQGSLNLLKSKDYVKDLRTKMSVFKTTTQTKKYLTWILITTFGLQQNQHSLGLIQNVLTLDDLFG